MRSSLFKPDSNVKPRSVIFKQACVIIITEMNSCIADVEGNVNSLTTRSPKEVIMIIEGNVNTGNKHWKSKINSLRIHLGKCWLFSYWQAWSIETRNRRVTNPAFARAGISLKISNSKSNVLVTGKYLSMLKMPEKEILVNLRFPLLLAVFGIEKY